MRVYRRFEAAVGGVSAFLLDGQQADRAPLGAEPPASGRGSAVSSRRSQAIEVVFGLAIG
jgi:hypothetical protein